MLPRSAVVILLAVLAAMLLSTSTVAKDNPNFLIATGKETTVGLAEPGKTTCIGGQTLGPLACGPGTQRVVVRDMVVLSVLHDVAGAGAAYLEGGTNQFTVNCNLDGDYQGHCWGTFEITIPGKGGSWEGSWGGTFDFAGNSEHLQAIGHGTGGDLDGLQLNYDYLNPGGLGYGLFTARVTTK